MDRAIATRKTCGFIKHIVIIIILGALPAFLTINTQAFYIQPANIHVIIDESLKQINKEGKEKEADWKGLSTLIIENTKDPVHERATNITYGCEDDIDHTEKCSNPKSIKFAPAAVIAGNQWNDNPSFVISKSKNPLCMNYLYERIQLPNAIWCWGSLFVHGEIRSEWGKYFNEDAGYIPLYRVHFGDMQFMHSMACRPGEAAKETQKKVMMWAELTYRLAIGDLDRLKILNTIRIDGLNEIFHNHLWTVEDLFTFGDKTYYEKKDFQDFAFGSLLHLVQDSFTASHTNRIPTNDGHNYRGGLNYSAPGEITQFYCYVGQVSSKHKEEDSQEALTRHLKSTSPNCVTVGKVLKHYYENGTPWQQVKPYLEKVFYVSELNMAGGPGHFDDEMKLAEAIEWNTAGQEE